LGGCALTLPEPPEVDLPTQPAVLLITPAPTLDIDATATFYADQLRPTATPAGLYVVQPGDTLGLLAERFHTTVEEIMVLNNLSDPNVLQAGDALMIPSLVNTAVVATPALTRTAQTSQVTATATLTVTRTLTPTVTLSTP
ncbi:MAG: LysM peptidoglycan-binding domain-containing protein, partial [Chloroflexaceae bacterium]|nr:LysM peptidoglycan-binding domain-containing protein [Chloroflexaceae bacterium]